MRRILSALVINTITTVHTVFLHVRLHMRLHVRCTGVCT
jgi:hypothetical protein